MIAMYGMSGEDGRQRIGEFLEEIRATRFDQRATVPVTMSAGLAEYPADGADLESLYRTSDEALYIAKEEGRDRVVHRASRQPDRPDVLLVEDDIRLGRPIEQALQTRGYRIRWITDGDEANAALTEPKPVAALLLLGGHPPSLGARRLLELARRAGTLARCRFILLPRETPRAGPAADGATSTHADALAFEDAEYVSPPLSVPALMQLIRSPPPNSNLDNLTAA